MSSDPLRDEPDRPPFRIHVGWTAPRVVELRHAIKPDWLCVFCGVKITGPDLSCAAPACVAQVPNDEDGR